jgi:hypothetical protein
VEIVATDGSVKFLYINVTGLSFVPCMHLTCLKNCVPTKMHPSLLSYHITR